MGANKIYTLPLPICPNCRESLRGQKAIKDCMQVIPAYQQLLEKFPDATMTVSDYGPRQAWTNELGEHRPSDPSFHDNKPN